MKNWFHKIKTYIVTMALCHYWSYYLEDVANNALTTPRNEYEQDVEDMLLSSMIETSKELEVDPATIAVLSPMLRQKAARELMVKLRDKKFIKEFIQEREG